MYIFASLMFFAVSVAAQDDASAHRSSAAAGDAVKTAELADTVAADPLMPRLWMPEPFYVSPWQLHSGFNAQLGMNVSVGFGKHSPRGVGIGSDATFMYAQPLGRRLAIAAGVGMHTLDWGLWRRRNASLLGVAAYRVNDFMNIYAFGEKSLVPGSQRRFRNYPDFAEDRWGGAVDFKLGDHVFVQFGVSQSRRSF